MGAADTIVVLRNGSIVESGTYEHLATIGGYFNDMIQAYQDSKDETAISKSSSTNSLSDAVEATMVHDTNEMESEIAISEDVRSQKRSDRAERPKSDMQSGQLIADEDREVGDVDLRVYKMWAMAAGGVWTGMGMIGICF